MTQFMGPSGVSQNLAMFLILSEYFKLKQFISIDIEEYTRCTSMKCNFFF